MLDDFSTAELGQILVGLSEYHEISSLCCDFDNKFFMAYDFIQEFKVGMAKSRVYEIVRENGRTLNR